LDDRSEASRLFFAPSCVFRDELCVSEGAYLGAERAKRRRFEIEMG
jgi:hypothetical protein